MKHTSQFILSHCLPARTICLIFHTILTTIKDVKQYYTFQNFMGDSQTAFLIWQLCDAISYSQDIYWYLIILFSQNFLSVFAPVLYEHTITHSLVCFIILSVPVVPLKLKTFCESLNTRGRIHKLYTPEHKQNCTKNHAMLKICSVASIMQLKYI